MRLSDGDREQMFDRLSRHAAAGSISLEELERRVGLVSEAQTREEAAAALADLPPLAPPPAEPAHEPWLRRRQHGEAAAPQPDWQPTAERFRDPRTGRVMRVWVDGTGGRHYVPDSG